jgi:hypothetical protein
MIARQCGPGISFSAERRHREEVVSLIVRGLTWRDEDAASSVVSPEQAGG